MLRRAHILPIVAVAVLATATVGSLKLAQAQADRPDCPGKIVCPLTGEQVCRDRCPTVDPNRSDCPGRILCPLTGEPVCRDRCPIGGAATKDADMGGKPLCCDPGT